MPEISIDEFLGKRKLSAHDGVLYRAAKMPKSFDAEKRSAVFIMTDETVDSYGDIVKANGANMDRFEKNPIALLNHRSDLILGGWSNVEKKRKAVEGLFTMAAEGTAPHVDMAFNLMSQGFLRAASIGFMPTKVERRLDDDGEPMWSYIIHEWELYECSIVSVPANPSALAKSVKDGNMLARDLLEEVLDTYVKTPAGLIISREEYEAAHKDANGNKTTILTTAIELDAKSLDRLEEIVARMEKAGKTVTKPASRRQYSGMNERQLREAVRRIAPEWLLRELGHIEQDLGAEMRAVAEDEFVRVMSVTDDDDVDDIAKELELNVEGFLKDFQPKVDEIDEPARKGTLTKLMDGLRSLFKAEEPPPPAPEKADPATQKALREQAEAIAAKYAA